ncbi:MAG: polysulfide reductase NrfD [Planctomycetes bacterium]|nr:polysulfide reductase NrfD [Planctomycetota bacterium]
MKRTIWIIVLCALIIAGFISWLSQLQAGLILTNLRNPFSWGLYISTFAFLVGVAAGGLIVSSSIYVFKIEALKPLAATGALSAFACVSGAGLMVIPDIGRPDRLYNLMLHPNFLSPLVWDIIVISGYATISLVYAYVLLLPHLAQGRSIFSLPFNKMQAEKLNAVSHSASKILAPVALPFAVLIHTVTAWIFATQPARPWWYSAILAPDFIAVAVASGSALVLLVSIISYGFRERLLPAYRILAKLSAIALIVHLFFMYNDFVIRSWAQKPGEFDALELLFSRMLGPHLIEVALPILAMIIFLSNGLRSKPAVLVTGIVFMLVGAFSHRFLLMPSAYNFIPLTLHMPGIESAWAYPIAVGEVIPGQPVFSAYWHYVPSLTEISITLGVLSLVAMIITIASAIFPFKSYTENK